MSAKHDTQLYTSKTVQYRQKERFKFKLILIYIPTHMHVCMYTGVPSMIKYSIICMHIQQYSFNHFPSSTGLSRQYSLAE